MFKRIDSKYTKMIAHKEQGWKYKSMGGGFTGTTLVDKTKQKKKR